MLLIDIGNSRIKAGVLEGAHIRPVAPFAWRGVEPAAIWPGALAGLERAAEVVVSNVAGPRIAADLGAWLARHWSIVPRVVAVQREMAGVVTRYEHPERLGVDRWLAAIAGYHLAGMAVGVIDGGTALTIDVVSHAGEHLGGLIAPGMGLMAQSLSRETAQLRFDGLRAVSGFATNTEDAISLGCQDAVAGAIRAAADRAAAMLGGTPLWFVTGGETEAILGISPIALKPVPDLVLQGLAIVAEQGA